VKSLGSAWGLDYSWIVGGTNIKLMCVYFLYIYLFIFVFLYLSVVHKLCMRICIPQIPFKLFYQRKRNSQKSLHNSTILLVCFSHF